MKSLKTYFNQIVNEAKYEIEISVRDARKAFDVLRDQPSIWDATKQLASNAYKFKTLDDYEEAIQLLKSHKIEILNESVFVNEAKELFAHDQELDVPLKLIKQIGFTSQWNAEWPDGNTVVIDRNAKYIKKISKEEYDAKVKDYFAHEKFMKSAYKNAKEREKQEAQAE
jgi:hypothetical protein